VTAVRSIRRKLAFLYGEQEADELLQRLMAVVRKYEPGIPKSDFEPTERDVALITYGDSFRAGGEPPLATLHRFLYIWLKDLVSIVHILPFFPYSSDDGFSVIDFRQVDPELGTWEHVERTGRQFTLMFDAVINHMSSRSGEFTGFLQGEELYRDFFIEVAPGTDLSAVFRPRALPLTTDFPTPRGPVRVWTTFSADQIDLNYANPEVLVYMVDLLLFYISRGASIIRLDAIAYLWKQIGTSCLHLPQTHTVIKLLRDLFDLAAPHALILTETNVPHSENVSYFGNGSDEAHMVYNFALPPLAAHSLITGDARALSAWAAGLKTPSPGTAFFNFTASHDGIGMLPARQVLDESQTEHLIQTALSRGGRIGYKSNPDGSRTAYELNISLFDFLSDPGGDEPLDLKADRFAASQALALSLAGLPALYYHSLVGSGNDQEGVRKTGVNRAINREKLNVAAVEEELRRPGSQRSLVFERLSRLLQVRRTLRAFHPQGGQRVLDMGPGIFAMERTAPGDSAGGHGSAGSGDHVLVLINMSEQTVDVRAGRPWRRDALSGEGAGGSVELGPYQVRWLVE
jgi:sucrose phosphorylase